MNKKVAVLTGSLLALAGANSILYSKSISESLVWVFVSQVIAGEKVVKQYDLTYEFFNISKESITWEKIDAVNRALSEIEKEFGNNWINITKSLISENILDYDILTNKLFGIYNKLWVKNTYNVLLSIYSDFWKDWIQISMLLIISKEITIKNIIYLKDFLWYLKNKWYINKFNSEIKNNYLQTKNVLLSLYINYIYNK